MKEKLTQERLKEFLHYDPITGILIRKVTTSRRAKAGDIAGCKSKAGYIEIRVDGKLYRAHRLAWLYEKGYFPEYGLDHKDRIKHHNWILNLRELSQQCNVRNTGNRKNNTSSVKGVYWFKRDKKWRAMIGINQKIKHLGLYNSFENAVCARLAGEQCLNWSGCDSSSPAYQYVQENIILKK
jgi:hypothetical protein